MFLEGAPNAQGGRPESCSMAMFLAGRLTPKGAGPAAEGVGSAWGGTGREKAFIVPTPAYAPLRPENWRLCCLHSDRLKEVFPCRKTA